VGSVGKERRVMVVPHCCEETSSGNERIRGWEEKREMGWDDARVKGVEGVIARRREI